MYAGNRTVPQKCQEGLVPLTCERQGHKQGIEWESERG